MKTGWHNGKACFRSLRNPEHKDQTYMLTWCDTGALRSYKTKRICQWYNTLTDVCVASVSYRFLSLSFLWELLLGGLALGTSHLCGGVCCRDELLEVLRLLLPFLLPCLNLPQLLDQVLLFCHLQSKQGKYMLVKYEAKAKPCSISFQLLSRTFICSIFATEV